VVYIDRGKYTTLPERQLRFEWSLPQKIKLSLHRQIRDLEHLLKQNRPKMKGSKPARYSSILHSVTTKHSAAVISLKKKKPGEILVVIPFAFRR
jgi:hypothetical protein